MACNARQLMNSIQYLAKKLCKKCWTHRWIIYTLPHMASNTRRSRRSLRRALTGERPMNMISIILNPLQQQLSNSLYSSSSLHMVEYFCFEMLYGAFFYSSVSCFSIYYVLLNSSISSIPSSSVNYFRNFPSLFFRMKFPSLLIL